MDSDTVRLSGRRGGVDGLPSGRAVRPARIRGHLTSVIDLTPARRPEGFDLGFPAGRHTMSGGPIRGHRAPLPRMSPARSWKRGHVARTDEAITRLRSMIQSGELPPGARLPPEHQLAAQMGISRG